MDKGIVVIPIERRASWARRFVDGVDNAPVAPVAARASPPPAPETSYNIHVVVELPHRPTISIAREVRERLAGLGVRSVEVI